MFNKFDDFDSFPDLRGSTQGNLKYRYVINGGGGGSVPTHFFICGFLYPLSIKSAGMKLNFEGTR